MDELRRELRELFDRRQSSFVDLADSRRRVMRAGMSARHESMDRRAQLIAGVATVVIAALIIATFVYVRGGVRSSPTAPIAKPSAAPTLPVKSLAPGTNVVVVDADARNRSYAWALISNCIQPMTGKCHYGVISTGDAGVAWFAPVRVGGDFEPSDGGAPRHIVFINPTDGFVYGGTVAFVTHDAGRTWSTLDAHVTFFNTIGGAGQRAWITSWPCAKAAACSYQVTTSADGGRTWSTPSNLPMGFYPFRAVAFGQDGLLLSDESPGDIELTRDGGVTWVEIPSQCEGNVLEPVVATSDGVELWELCLTYPNPATAPTAKRSLHVSEDGGRTWSSRAISAIPTEQAASGFFEVAASSRTGTLVIASNQSSMTITHDAGRTWTDVGPPGVGFLSIRFIDSNVGVAIDVTRGMWVTTDGGDPWSQVPIDVSGLVPI